MKLSTKTLFSFIGVILFQAGLTVSILSYFIYQQNQEVSVNAMKREARLVYNNYNSWKTRFWKNLITLKRNNILKRLSSQLSNETEVTKIIGHLATIIDNVKELLITSGVDFVVIKTDDRLMIRSVSGNKTVFVDLFARLPKVGKSYPYLENKVFDETLTLIGAINLAQEKHSEINVYLIKIIDRQFLTKLVSNADTEVFIYIDDVHASGEINQEKISRGINVNELNHFYNVLTDLTFNDVRYNGIVKKIGSLYHKSQSKRIFLGTLISTEGFSSSEAIIYNVIFSVFILGSILAIILSWFLSNNITHPVRNLLAAMNKIKSGRFDNPIRGKYSAEIQELFHGFNDMLRNLNRQKNRMDQYVHEISSLKDYNERIIDSISTSVLSINNHYCVEKVNQGFLSMFSVREKDILHQDIRDIKLGVFDHLLIDKIKQIVNKDRSSYIDNKRIGPKQIFEIKLYRIHTANSELGCVMLINDISKKLELEKKILQAEKLSSISMLSAGVAHEINNPLSSILANVQYLNEEEQNDEKISALRWIKQETARIGEIVKRLLDFASTNQSENQECDINAEILKIKNLIHFHQRTR